MSILHFDSFQADGHSIGKYTSWNGGNDLGSAFGRDGDGVRMDANTTCMRVDFSANPTYIMNFTFRVTNSNDNTIDNIAFREGSTTHIGMNLKSVNKQVQVERGTTQIDLSAVNTYQLNTWHHFEMKVFIHDSTGTVEVRVDGTTVVNLSSFDTRNGGAVGTIDNILLQANSGTPTQIDNLIMMDNLGGINDDFIGDCVIEHRAMNGNGNYSQWDGSDGNQVDNYLQVDEGRAHDGDTTYNAGQVALEKDTYAAQDLVATTGSVLAVQAGLIARHEGQGGTLRHMLRRSSTDQFGAALTPGGGYTYHSELWEQDPNAGPGAWTIANVNATEFGFELVS